MNDGPILVLGASGLLGRTLIEAAADAGQAAVGLSRDDCDITDGRAVEKALTRHRPRLIVNAAAFTDVDAAESNRAAAAAVNAEGTANIGWAAAQAGVPVIHISTDCVFDGRLRRPYREDDAVAPLGQYGRSKAEGEARLRATQPRHVILRSAWLFGDRGGGFARMATALALRRKSVRTIVDQIGSPTAAVDLAGAILAVDRAIGRDAAPWGTYHYAGAQPASRREVVETIFEAVRGLGRAVPEIVPVSLADFAAAAPRPIYSALDSGRFVRTFGHPASDWKKHLAALVEREAARMELPAT